MKATSYTLGIGALILIYLVLLIQPSHAAVPMRYTNDNLWTSTPDTAITISVDEHGNFFGRTESGKSFRQETVENDLGVRLQRFSVDDAFFYISDHGIIEADSDLSALSIYLAQLP